MREIFEFTVVFEAKTLVGDSVALFLATSVL
jgi:hypothetical protein